MTKPIHPRPSVMIEGQKPPRIRRTNSQIAEDEASAQTAALLAYAKALAEKRLAKATPAQKAMATRLLRRWHS